MPELPEVETIRKDLKKMIVGKMISAVDIIEPRSVRNKPDLFKRILRKNSFADMKRKGKLLIMELSGGNSLLVRLGMTGQLIYGSGYVPTKHTRAIIGFEDGSKLFFNDIRKFGSLFAATDPEKDLILRRIGIDPLDKRFSLEYFKALIKNKKRTLKAFLLDQGSVSGIGNIYADEICFDSKLKPGRNISGLNDMDIEMLYNSIIRILHLAIKNRGTTFSDYVDASGKKGRFSGHLKVYGKEKDDCARCKTRSIKKIRVAGRSTRFCELCQK
jgi:formamidopyrimidine-DNA glycosylase